MNGLILTPRGSRWWDALTGLGAVLLVCGAFYLALLTVTTVTGPDIVAGDSGRAPAIDPIT
ncbi:hypothetical protein NUV30_08985 [Kocuria rhizophila]|uniref:hypothetical protein n=1 Tax=Kocuria TaxID=57493 RepID=UPI00214F856A|nr:hypothetical protein [Kocuria rhizophila]MCR4526503.1 hypothetical protein [Kocuria rhizophila]WIW68205.1 hypothetical protein P8S73_11100 [Kocuria sp. ChxB]